MIHNPHNLSQLLKSTAKRYGFKSCGISKSGALDKDARQLEAYLKKDFHGQMHYMANHFEKRTDTTKLVEGSRSVISLLYNYYPSSPINTLDNLKISKYAYGQDYHEIIKGILREMVEELTGVVGDFSCRIFVDSAPVLERAWARESGLGWVGKNANLITRDQGSFFFLAEIITDLEIAPDGPIKDYCGTCRRCIEACPTQAIVEDKVVDGSKCISYATIELKDELPESFKGKMEEWMFGCDICQDVCPWNRFSKPHSQVLFEPSKKLTMRKKEDWKELTQEVFSEIFRKSPVKRTKFAGLKRNIEFITKNDIL